MATGFYINDTLEDSGWLTLESNLLDSGNSILYRKIGNVVYLQMYAIKLATASSDTNTILGYMPSGYSPSYSTNFSMRAYSSSTGNITLFGSIGADGKILAMKPQSLSSIGTDLAMNVATSYLV